MITFTTFTTFLLLATLLFVTLVAVKAMRGEREELQHNCDLLDSVIELEKELTSLYEQRAEREALLVEKTQQIHDLQLKLFETKESFKPWIESLQQESDEWADIAKDREAKIKSLEQEILNNKESSYFLLESYQEDLDVAQDCIWDKSKQISIKMELLNEIAEELFSIGLQDTIRAEDVFKVRELALGQDIPF